MSEHTINQLSALSGLSVRTIRYYLAQGLLPSAGKEGPASRYPEATLARLRLTARLRDAHLPLAEIRKRLLALTDLEVIALAGTTAEPEPTETALDYVRSVLGGSRPELHGSQPAPSPVPLASVLRARCMAPQLLTSAPAPGTPGPTPAAVSDAPLAPHLAARELAVPLAQSRALLTRADFDDAATDGAHPRADPIPPFEQAQFGQRSQWERTSITSDIELHVRRPLSRRDNRLVERLLAFARQLGEEQP